MSEIVVFDVGNTAATAALWRDGALHSLVSLRHGDAAFARELGDWIANVPATATVAVAAVDNGAARRVADALEPRRVLIAPRDFAPDVENRCDPQGSVGLDRLFNARAIDPAREAVVIDAGTAITVDRIGRGRVFHGGAIAPGVRMCFAALHRGTAQLPLVDPSNPSDPSDPGSHPPEPLGTSTPSAIRSGVLLGLAGAIDRLAELIGAGADEFVATGGDATLLAPMLRCRPRLDPTLTLRGIAAAATAALSRKAP